MEQLRRQVVTAFILSAHASFVAGFLGLGLGVGVGVGWGGVVP